MACLCKDSKPAVDEAQPEFTSTQESMSLEVFQSMQSKHEERMLRIVQDLHNHLEQRLASAVDLAVRQAISEAPKSSLTGRTLQPSTSTPTAPVSSPHKQLSANTPKSAKESDADNTGVAAGTISGPDGKKADSFDETPQQITPNRQMQRNSQLVSHDAGAVVSLARADSMHSSTYPTGTIGEKLEKILYHPGFDYAIVTVILANAVQIAVQTEVAAQNLQEKSSIYKGLDLFFTIFFAVELALRAVVEKQRFVWGRNKAWNLFDAVVVGCAIVEEVLSASTSSTGVRVLRVMRLVRMIRVIRTLRIFHDLRALVNGIKSSILSLLWAIVLLLMICFVASIFITQMVTSYRQEDNIDPNLADDLETYFGSLLATMFSCYMAITGGKVWSFFANQLFTVSHFLGVFFCFYIAFGVFAVLNVMTGVFVTKAIRAHQSDTEEIIMEQNDARKNHIEKVKSIFKKADKDGSGLLDFNEFRKHLEDTRIQAYFRQLDMDIEGHTAKGLFDLLDFDSSGFIDIEEFVFGCSHFKGYARSLDIARMAHNQKIMLHTLHKQEHRLVTILGDVSMIMTQCGFQPAGSKTPLSSEAGSPDEGAPPEISIIGGAP